MGTTAVYPELTIKMAMKIGGKYEPDEVYVRHWHRLKKPPAAVSQSKGKTSPLVRNPAPIALSLAGLDSTSWAPKEIRPICWRA